MNIIKFNLKKNNKNIINEDNIKCIYQNNKLIFKIDNIKYKFYNNILIKESPDEIITLDFNERKCKIHLLEINKDLFVNITYVNIKKYKNIIKIEYKIETDNNSLNIITLEYKKSS